MLITVNPLGNGPSIFCKNNIKPITSKKQKLICPVSGVFSQMMIRQTVGKDFADFVHVNNTPVSWYIDLVDIGHLPSPFYPIPVVLNISDMRFCYVQ